MQQSRRPVFRVMTMAAGPGLCLLALPAWAAEARLPVGNPPAFDPLWVLLRLLVGLLGLALLISGAHRPRLVVGSVALVVSVAVGYLLLGKLSLLLAAGAAWLLSTLVLGLFIRWPRLVVGLSSWWPVPALMVCWLLYTGSFERHVPLMLVLAAAALVLGFMRPALGLTMQAATLGAVLLAWAQETVAGPALALVAAAGALGGHLLLFLIEGRFPERWRIEARARAWRQSMLRVAGVLAGLLLVLAFVAPVYGPPPEASSQRWAELTDAGRLARPALVTGANNNLYLGGVPHAVAVVGGGSKLGTRLLVPLLGRSFDGALREMRLFKDEQELAAMRRAAAVTSATFAEIEPLIRPGVSEAAIDAAIRSSFARQGADGLAFASVVGAGENAVNPHYQRNDALMSEGLVVIDIGCSVGGYASDMTRTFPVQGELSEAQAELVATTLAAYEAARELCGPGALLSELDTRAKEVIAEAGFAGLMSHGIGHHVGLNVHDPHRDELEPGMVVTIEPGIYVARGASVDPAFWGLGVRHEDSFLVTEEGCESLTHFRPAAFP